VGALEHGVRLVEPPKAAQRGPAVDEPCKVVGLDAQSRLVGDKCSLALPRPLTCTAQAAGFRASEGGNRIHLENTRKSG